MTERAAAGAQAPFNWVNKIVSGGQSGADRAALDWAIAAGIEHGGWCPAGRRAEDGIIDAKYRLVETESADYRERTGKNVADSDGTLIVNLGELGEGTLETLRIARKLSKPHLVVQADHGIADEDGRAVVAWLQQSKICTLNVAGPRASKRPGIYAATWRLLDLAAKASSGSLPPVPA